MTSAIATQRQTTGPSTTLHTITLAFAALTLLFALLSLILGSRLATLQTNFLSDKIETVASEAASVQDMEVSLKTAIDKLEAAQKGLKKENAVTERLRRQLSDVMKNLEKAKAELAAANQTISALRSSAQVQSAPKVATPEATATPIVVPSTKVPSSQDPEPQSISQPSESSTVLPAPVSTSENPSTTTAPAPPAVQHSTDKAVPPEQKPETATHPAIATPPPDITTPVTEETIPDPSTASPPAAAPVAD
jgi:flagellar hook-basal body complex protein FliE